jgi:hypothetical protein
MLCKEVPKVAVAYVIHIYSLFLIMGKMYIIQPKNGKRLFQFPFFILLLAASSMVMFWEQQSFAQLPESSDSTVTDPTGFLTYNNATYGVTIQYPSTWSQSHVAQEEAGALTISSFRSPEQADRFAADTLIAIEYLDQSMTVEEYLDATINFYSQDPSHRPDFQLLSSNISDFLTLADMPAYSLEYTYTLEGWGPQRVLEVGTIVGDRAYYIEYAADSAVYQKYLPTAQEMINSFELISDVALENAPAIESGLGGGNASTTTNQQDLGNNFESPSLVDEKTPPVAGMNDNNFTSTTTIPEEQQQQQQGEDWLVYENATYGVSISYPSSWTQQDGTDSQQGLITVSDFLSPSEENGSFADVSIAIEDVSPSMSVEEYLNLSVDTYSQDPSTFPDFQLISSSMGDFSLLGMPAYSLEINYTDPEFGPLRMLEVGTIVDNKAYYVQYNADVEIFDNHLQTAEEMISSMQLRG